MSVDTTIFGASVPKINHIVVVIRPILIYFYNLNSFEISNDVNSVIYPTSTVFELIKLSRLMTSNVWQPL